MQETSFCKGRRSGSGSAKVLEVHGLPSEMMQGPSFVATCPAGGADAGAASAPQGLSPNTPHEPSRVAVPPPHHSQNHSQGPATPLPGKAPAVGATRATTRASAAPRRTSLLRIVPPLPPPKPARPPWPRGWLAAWGYCAPRLGFLDGGVGNLRPRGADGEGLGTKRPAGGRALGEGTGGASGARTAGTGPATTRW